MLLHIY